MQLNFCFPWSRCNAMMFRITFALLFLLLGACDSQTTSVSLSAEPGSKPVVLTSNYPLYFFASEIAGDAVDIRMPDIDGDPAMWVPGPSSPCGWIRLKST